MRSSAALPLLFSMVVSASPIVDPKAINAVFCSVNNIVISALAKDRAATTYCSSFLSIPTSTLTTTATQTPTSITTTLSTTITGAPTTTTLTETATTTAQVTSISTSTTTVLTTVTSTTSTSTITCLDAAYTSTAPTGVIPGGDNQKREERRGAVPKPAVIPAAWASSYVSTACSCLSIPTPSVTSTVTKTLAPGTVSVTSTIIATPTVTASETTTVTETSTTPITEIATTTSTVTAYAVATTIASNGVQYRKYSSPYREETDNAVTASYFKTATADFGGNVQSLSFSSPNWPSSDYSITLADGRSFDGQYGALLLQGFFIAKETGTYAFLSNSGEIDNYGYLWTGDKAYSAWNDGNANWKSVFDGGRTTVSSSVQMNAGDAIPLTYLWVNTGGPGQSIFRFITPGGAGVTGGNGYFVRSCSATTFA